jgi:hypothetical protein
MNKRTKELFNKLVVEQWADFRAYHTGISLETYRELCERKLQIDTSFGGTGRVVGESQESYRERCESRKTLSDAFYKELKEKNICMDWVNAPRDIISDQQFEAMYAEQNGWTDR